MAYYLVFALCIGCGNLFGFNPQKVPSIRVDGVRQPASAIPATVQLTLFWFRPEDSHIMVSMPAWYWGWRFAANSPCGGGYAFTP